MTIDLASIAMAVMGGILAALTFFLKRELSRLDDMQKSVESIANKFSEIAADVKIAAELKAQISALNIDWIKFFGDRGERQTMWKKIDDISQKISTMEENVRERDHWVANKITVIYGKLQMAKLTDGTEAGEWKLPAWKE